MNAEYLCRVCGSKNLNLAIKAKDLNRYKSDKSFSYYKCGDCKSFSIQPIPLDLGAHYAGDYPAYLPQNNLKIAANYLLLELDKIKIVKKFIKDGFLVEIGPAAGRFLLEAKKSGYTVMGLELDGGCVDHIKNVLEINVKQTSEPSVELISMKDSVDVIVAWHVIEHLADLRNFISSVRTALRNPYGVVVFSAPNPNSWSFKIFKKYWVHLDAPRHLTLMPLEALDKLMMNEGFIRATSIYNDLTGIQLNRMGWQNSFINLSNDPLFKKYFLSILGRILSILMNVFDKLPGRGAAYTAVYVLNRDKFLADE